MGEVAEAINGFVSAYSGDLNDETLDGQRVVIGGIVTGLRMVVTKARASMAIVTLEDVQGTVEVVVFPRTWEETASTWKEGAILLVAGRIDHRGDNVSLLADLVVEWDAAAAAGPEVFARQVAAADRGRGGRRSPPAAASGSTIGAARSRPQPNGAPDDGHGDGGRPPAPPIPPVVSPSVPYVSPLRAEARPDARLEPRPDPAVVPAVQPAGGNGIVPGEPVPTYREPDDMYVGDAGDDDEPALPDEARGRVLRATRAPTVPTDPSLDRVLHVRFSRAAETDRLVGAMEEVRAVLRARPGVTRVVLHLPQEGTRESLPMELRTRVAYDAELLAEVSRRLGEGVVDLQLA